MTLYAVRRKDCGCLVNVQRCRNQQAPIGSMVTHPDRDKHKEKPVKQEGLFE